MSLQQQFEQLVNSKEKTELAQLEALWDQLDSVDQPFMMGEWTGGVFNTGHPGEKQLTVMKWVGKNFHSLNDVDPIVCSDDTGGRVASPVMGKASCRLVAYRGAVTATMVYDN
ncbi:MAG TPA: GXWXG domain-containing protein, partial [Pseudomonadales bacterium]|nr:GXWXG domain-containing protein [Pseudomonadales bacterium]